MSALPQERLGSEIVEPDSELRAALQRVARDLEQSSRHQRHRTVGLQHEHSGDALGRISHQKSDSAQSIHVEDILDQSALDELPVDGTSYAVSQEGISHRNNGQPSHQTRILSHTSSIPEMDQHQGGLDPSTSRMTGNHNGSRDLVDTLLETVPTIGFLKFLDEWLESRGLKSVERPSPVLEEWKSLDPSQRSSHEDRARFELGVRHSVAPGKVGHLQRGSRSTGGNRKNRSSKDSVENEDSGSSMIGRVLSDPEKKAVDDLARNIVQQLDVLHQVSGTNYLLLTAPVFQASDSFPVLSHSPPAEAYWQGLRGGPGTNLAKFLALSHPAVTCRRLAIPQGARSLDVKSRLNASMRHMIREASNVADAEMKWTRPESLVQIYGVKIVGWPMGAPGAEDEMVPMRNPSNNSVAQNKLLLSRIEAGILRVEIATEDDRISALADGSTPDVAKSTKSRDGESDSVTLGGSATNVPRTDSSGDPLYDNVTAESSSRGNRTDDSSSKRGRATKVRGIAPSTRPKYRSKSLLTLNPDGSIRPGGLEGKRGPGRPRKEVPISTEELPHLSNSIEYHANQRRIAQEQEPSPTSLVEDEHRIEGAGDPQDMYIQTGELGENNPEMVLAMMGPALGTTGESGGDRYPETPDVNDDQPQHHERDVRSSDHLPSPLDQALSHIEYYQVTGPNFGNHPSSMPRPHTLTNIAPHFPLPPPEDDHDESHDSSNQSEQQYISDFATRMPIISSYNGHFPDSTDQAGDDQQSWHDPRHSEDPLAHTAGPEAGQAVLLSSRHHLHHSQMDDNPDIVDGIDMEAAFGNPHILSGDPLSDRTEVGDMAEMNMRSFLASQVPHQHQDSELDHGGLKGKRKADELRDGDQEEQDEELEGILKRARAN